MKKGVSFQPRTAVKIRPGLIYNNVVFFLPYKRHWKMSSKATKKFTETQVFLNYEVHDNSVRYEVTWSTNQTRIAFNPGHNLSKMTPEIVHKRRNHVLIWLSMSYRGFGWQVKYIKILAFMWYHLQPMLGLSCNAVIPTPRKRAAWRDQRTTAKEIGIHYTEFFFFLSIW